MYNYTRNKEININTIKFLACCTMLLSIFSCSELRKPPYHKIYHDWKTLKAKVDSLAPKKLVMTGGTFDIIHPGHVHVLYEAKKQGDLLIVAINTDESVKRCKGQNRPVNTLMNRSAVIAALEPVDYVIIFSQDTPLELIKYFKPDVFVKGGDYTKEKVSGYEYIKGYGGSVFITDYVTDASTTNIVNKIQKDHNYTTCEFKEKSIKSTCS